MERNRILRWALIGLLIAFVFLLIFQSGRQRFSWRETFKMNSKEPYGLYALHQLMQLFNGKDQFFVLEDSLVGQLPPHRTGDEVANYLFVGQGMYMRPSDRDALLNFVAEGNQAFIATKVLPYDLMFHLYYEVCDDLYAWDGTAEIMDSTIRTSLVHPDLPSSDSFHFTYQQRFKGTATRWGYFPDYYLCEKDQPMVPIGYANDTLANLVRIPHGDGHFFLHSQPRLFTNLFITETAGKSYTEQALSHLGAGPIYWDEYSRIPERMARDRNDDYNQFDNEPTQRLNSESALQYILEQPSLAWAWYLLLALGIIYMLFRTKRRQQIVPVLPKKENSSLQLVQNLGFLYYQQSSHIQVARQAIKLFRTHVHERYGLSWRPDDKQFIDQLCQRSSISQVALNAILTDIQQINKRPGISSEELTTFHQRLEAFYQANK